MLRTEMKSFEVDHEKIKKDFPIFSRRINGKPLVYLDNAATSQKPESVINKISEFYSKYNSNVHRGVHKLSEEATVAFEDSRKKVADFIKAKYEETIFTSGTTESINMIANMVPLKRGDEVVVSEMEHHSSFIPFQQAAIRNNCEFKIARMNECGELDVEKFSEMMSKKTKVVSIAHVSNVLGTINDIKKISKIAHENDSLLVVDAAQSVPHMEIDVNKLDADFMAFSAHKMLGPTGIGVLYGKKELLEKISPSKFGGGMVSEVSKDKSEWLGLPHKLEAGTPNISGAIGFAAAIEYLEKIGMENIESHDAKITRYAVKRISEEAKVYGMPEKNIGSVSFNVGDVHPHDVSQVLDEEGVAVRGGHHCAKPLMKALGIQSCVRASFYIYNSKQDVDALVDGIKKVKGVFK